MVKLNSLLGYVCFGSTLAFSPCNSYSGNVDSLNKSPTINGGGDYISCNQIAREIGEGLERIGDARGEDFTKNSRRLDYLLQLERDQNCYKNLRRESD